MAQGTPQDRAAAGESRLSSFDPGVPNPARMWNYWLGGKDNFAADRELAERVLQAMPSMPLIAQAVRLFLIDAVHQVSTVHGIRCLVLGGFQLGGTSARRARGLE